MADDNGTAETGRSAGRSPVEQLLDLVVYAPLGLLLNLDELVPQLARKGHQQVDMARMFGKFAVQTGTKEAKKRLGDLGAPASGSARGTAPPASDASAASASSPTASATAPAIASAGATTPASTPVDDPGPVPSAGELGISDYDALSASQVVPRLNGLSTADLDAVRRYETANRGRKTILAKITQLQA